MTEREELEKQIAEAQEKLAKLEQQSKINKKSAAIKELGEYTTEEKVVSFNKLYKSALLQLEELETRGYEDEDNEHYGWEEFISILARDKKLFWKYWNSLSK